MRVLIVANYNSGRFSSYVLEQASSIKGAGIDIDFYGIVGKGVWGYLKNLISLKRRIKQFKPDIIHAHYGLAGLCANLQRKVPVITTYHGSDIHTGGLILFLSRMAMMLSIYNIFVSNKLYELSKYKKSNFVIQPCGLNMETFKSIPKKEAREILNISSEAKIGLFSSNFGNRIKNYALAKEAIDKTSGVKLIELKNFNRQEVNLYLNACDFQLTTSIRESGPLVVKEAMACGTPVVSVDVGDVKEIIGNTNGCFIAERNADDIAKKIKEALSIIGKTNGRERILELGLDNREIAKKIIMIYNKVLN